MGKERYGVIYKITNKINNKVYIGQTTMKGGFDERYRNNVYKNTHNDYLERSIEKYGIENFEIDKEIYIGYSKEDIDSKEIEFIRQYQSNNKKYGYNYLSGGHRGKHNEESKRKIGDAQKGELNHMYGKFGKANSKYSRISSNCAYCGASIEVAQHRIRRSKNHYCSQECSRKDHSNIMTKSDSKIEAKCSNCHEKFSKFPSKLENKQHLYCSRKCQNEHYKTRFTGENNPNFGNGEKVKGGNNGRAKKVICVTTGEFFDCARDAEIHYGVNRGGVSDVCRGKQKSAGKHPETREKLTWMYF